MHELTYGQTDNHITTNTRLNKLNKKYEEEEEEEEEEKQYERKRKSEEHEKEKKAIDNKNMNVSQLIVKNVHLQYGRQTK